MDNKNCNFCLKNADFSIANIRSIVFCCDDCIVENGYMSNHGTILRPENVYFLYSINLDAWIKLPLENE
jgi:hypothetical protein